MIKRIGCCHLCGNRPILEIPLKNGVDFGHTPDLPNEAAQWATIYGIMNPTHRRSHQGIFVTLLNNPWLHLLGDPTGHSVNSYKLPKIIWHFINDPAKNNSKLESAVFENHQKRLMTHLHFQAKKYVFGFLNI